MSTTDSVETAEDQPEAQPQEQPEKKRHPILGKVLRRLLLLFLFFGVPLLIFVVLVNAIFGSLFTPANVITERTFNSRLWGEGEHKIAIIRLSGTIMSGEGYIKKQIDRVIEDKTVKGVVLRINSPGGLVSGSNTIYHNLLEMREARSAHGKKLPLVVSMGAIAASGGYYAAMAVEDGPIFAEPITWTGSIGVIIPHYNAAEFMAEHGLEEDSIKSHALKGMGGFAKKMTDEERAILQGLVDDSFKRFKDIVAKGRPKMTREKIDAVATGQVYTIEQALKNGLVDHEGYIEDAIRACIEKAGLSEGNVRVVEYQQQPGLWDMFLAQAKPPQVDLAAALKLTLHERYYIAPGWLASVLTSQQR